MRVDVKGITVGNAQTAVYGQRRAVKKNKVYVVYNVNTFVYGYVTRYDVPSCESFGAKNGFVAGYGFVRIASVCAFVIRYGCRRRYFYGNSRRHVVGRIVRIIVCGGCNDGRAGCNGMHDAVCVHYGNRLVARRKVDEARIVKGSGARRKDHLDRIGIGARYHIEGGFVKRYARG